MTQPDPTRPNPTVSTVDALSTVPQVVLDFEGKKKSTLHFFELKKSKKSKKRESELIESTDIIMKNPTNHIEETSIQPKKKKSNIDKSKDSSKDSSDQITLEIEEVETSKNQPDSQEKKKKNKKLDSVVVDVSKLETSDSGKKENVEEKENVKAVENEDNVEKKKKKKKSVSKVEDVPKIEVSKLDQKDNVEAVEKENNVEKKKKKKKSDSKVEDAPNVDTSVLALGKEESITVVDNGNKVEKKKKKSKTDSKVEKVPDIETPDLVLQKEESAKVADNGNNTEKKKKKKKIDSNSADAPNLEPSDLPSGKEESVKVLDNELNTEKKKTKKKSDSKVADVPKIETPDFLLGKKESEKVVDSELDTLFKSSAFLPASVPDIRTTQNATSSKPTAKKAENPSTNTNLPRTSTLSSKQPNPVVESDERPDTGTSEEVRSALQKAQRFAQSLRAAPSTTSTNTKSRAIISGNVSSDEETGQELDDDDDDESVSNLVHETLLSRKNSAPNSHQRTRKTRPSILNETPEERNLRTVFVGNVNVDCVKNKALARDLIDHLLNPESESEPLAPRSRIESYRFRGIPLATPIVSREQQPENRSEKRSKTWRETQNSSHADPSGKPTLDNPEGGRVGRRGAKTAFDETGTATLPEVQYLTPNQKRKVGYVTGDLHPEAKSCVAYLVISPPPESSQSEEDGSSLTAQELAKLISEKSDATSFMGHVLRCDLAGARRISQDGSDDAQIIDFGEQRRTLYIGGLDFMEHEDTVRKAVEAQLTAEKEGPPSDGGTWVERVRLVRDKGTSLGKGFGYVLLKSKDAVEEMLALESFKIGKRKVRVQKYVVPGKCSALKKLGQQIQTPSTSTSNDKHEKPSKRVKLDLTRDVPAIYKGPDLSEALKSKTKDERKSIKMSTPARVERRILKKQAKLKLKIAGQEVDKKIEAVKSKPLKRSIKKPMSRAPKQQRRPDKKKA
ncbi:uncharacterized protein MELLADRAFT_115064 [Melampsora larici-populina 98AG31]|uniref:Nucleolar protein 12 n=1 Tax=Melampsora larici-populina (strain 98AG31 / pathotype 3-4-7) TaxID=747676 RepID=F4R704_MELLP|nr:uncharacterized protein MELLADRAFT_115064 [Melampsora larici-populina 98AG31]EGG11960.1 hypothetical protein MELLADRAFT_115064 [Melampsora larici-populina 98AG31]